MTWPPVIVSEHGQELSFVLGSGGDQQVVVNEASCPADQVTRCAC